MNALFLVMLLIPMTALSKIDIVVAQNQKGFPPYSIYSQDSFKSGILIDIIVEIQQKSSLQFNFIYLPEKRMRFGLDKQTLDAVLTAKEWVPKSDSYVFSEPILTVSDIVVGSAALSKRYNKIEDLDKQTVGVVRGYVYSKDFMMAMESKKFGVYEGADEEQLMKLVDLQRIDCAIVTEQVAHWISKQLNLSKKLKFHKFQDSKFDYRVLIHKKYEAQLKVFNQHLRMLRKDGTLAKIAGKYRA